MGRDLFQMRLSTERERLFAKAEELGEHTNRAELVEAALRHYIETHEAFEDVKRELSPELAERIGTSEVKITMYPDIRH